MDLNTITTKSVIAWARSKAPEDTFRFVDNRHCFFAQYLRDVQGIEAWVSTTAFWEIGDRKLLHNIPEYVQDALSDALDVTPTNSSGKSIRFHMVADFLEKAA